MLLGYNLVTQLFPALLLSLPDRPIATGAGAVAGVLAGEAAVAWLTLSDTTPAALLPGWPASITDLNTGILALAVKVVAIVAVSAATRRTNAAGA